MWDVLLLFSSICTAVVGAPETVIGHRGERVDIRCPYDSGYESNSKYFCKRYCLLPNNIIIKSGSPAEDERFSLTDNTTARVFTVTITDLRTEDAGRYWCVVERFYNIDVYSEIVLQVEQAVRTDLASVAGGLGSVLLVLTLCSGTLLIRKKRKRKHGTALFQQNVQHNTETDHIYEDIPEAAAVTSSCNQTPASSSNQTPASSSNQTPASSSNQTPASSSNQTPASHLNTHPKVTTVYATVTNQQPDSTTSHTHSTNQVTDTDCDYYANIKSPEATQDSRTELIYTTATHPQSITTSKCPIYSVINQK